MDLQQIETKTIHPKFGLAVWGIEPHENLETNVIEFLKKAIQDFHLVVVKGKTPLLPKEQIDFTTLFGSPQKFNFIPGQFKEYPEVFKVTNKPGDAYANVGQYWHADGSIFNKPTYLSLYNIQQIPEEGSSTYFTSLIDALNRLPEELKKDLSTIESLHGTGYKNHPIIWNHPISGTPVLHVSEGFKGGYIDANGYLYSPKEAEELHEMLNKHLWEKDTFYEHQWEYGDLIIADNYAVAHHAKSTTGMTSRVLHRTAVHGKKRT